MPQVKDIFRTMEYGLAPEANGEVNAWLDGNDRRFGHFIGGAFTPPSGEGFDVLEPATGHKLATVAQGGKAEVDAAVEAARKAFKPWAALGGDGRARYLYAIARILQKRERFFSVLETMDNGKPIRESRDIDIPLVVRHFYHHAGWAELLDSEFPNHAPVGVCGQIIPWNFPLLMLAWKVAPALAAGNCVVLKPAEYTPLTALAFAEICAHVGLPAGVVNIVTGDGETGAALVQAPVDKIAFTGSTEVGKLFMQYSGQSNLKRVGLECGGKSPNIIFADAPDVKAAAVGAAWGIFYNQGEVCNAGSRVLVEEAVRDEVVETIVETGRAMRVGDPLDPATQIGAIVDRRQTERVMDYIAIGRSEGARLVSGGGRPQGAGACFIEPTVFDNVGPEMRIAREEIFGPVLAVLSFRDEAEAVRLANDTIYGLAAGLWTRDVNRTFRVSDALHAGVVWVNCFDHGHISSPFGGFKQSGFGRDKSLHAIEKYTDIKTTWINLG